MNTIHIHNVKRIIEERDRLTSGTFVRTLTIETTKDTTEIHLFASELTYLTSNRLKQEDKDE